MSNLASAIKVGEVDGYVSHNPSTILARILRGRVITAEQKDIALSHSYTEREIDNVRYSLEDSTEYKAFGKDLVL